MWRRASTGASWKLAHQPAGSRRYESPAVAVAGLRSFVREKAVAILREFGRLEEVVGQHALQICEVRLRADGFSVLGDEIAVDVVRQVHDLVHSSAAEKLWVGNEEQIAGRNAFD